ncbi:MAG TPA: DNA adenine methylase [Chitinophagales bacterium]|nr:DNA adenine methylase [Chitinophagales bacterium]
MRTSTKTKQLPLKPVMKTPVSYYGGKQKLCAEIINRIPKHNLYCEPFIGGAAIFFGKEKSRVEVINDTNKELINFYKVVQQDFVSLEMEIRISLHSRDLHKKANVIYNNPDMFSDIRRAWAVWVLSSQSFCSMLDGSFGYDKVKNTVAIKINNKKQSFTEDYAIRLQNVQLECTDALRVINSRDTKDSFFYCDPPYYNSDCGHYDGYSIQDFENLLQVLSNIKGKFMLSSYPSEILKKFTKAHGWHTAEFKQLVSVNAKGANQKTKIEVLTANYPI